VVSAQVRLRLLPKLVVVLGLDHLAARAVDPFHVGIVGSVRSQHCGDSARDGSASLDGLVVIRRRPQPACALLPAG
jgi:hypothetical protein